MTACVRTDAGERVGDGVGRRIINALARKAAPPPASAPAPRADLDSASARPVPGPPTVVARVRQNSGSVPDPDADSDEDADTAQRLWLAGSAAAVAPIATTDASASAGGAATPLVKGGGLAPSKYGYLFKQGGRIRGWKRRWFIYEKGELAYFKAVQVRARVLAKVCV
jgi:hypothetical protein